MQRVSVHVHTKNEASVKCAMYSRAKFTSQVVQPATGAALAPAHLCVCPDMCSIHVCLYPAQAFMPHASKQSAPLLDPRLCAFFPAPSTLKKLGSRLCLCYCALSATAVKSTTWSTHSGYAAWMT